MDSIPQTFRPLVKRLEQVQPPLSCQELQSILFVVRLGDLLHRSFYASFLTLSLVSKLSTHLNIADLTLELEVFVLKWSFRQGTVQVSHRISFDYDMYTVFRLTKIARAVLQDRITPKQGLLQIQQHERKNNYKCLEAGYREFGKGRGMVIPLMSFTCATVYFGGTWYDLGFSFACGVVAGIVAWITTLNAQLGGVMDYLVAILVAMISVASVHVFPDACCFSAQVMGTLYWFFYGTAFVLSIYEITNNQLMTGLSRFVQATLRSYGLAFGSLIGVWIAKYGDTDRFDDILAECSKKQFQIPQVWFALLFPLSAIACLMQFRVSLKHFFICLIVQAIAYGSQVLIGTTWGQPEFVANLAAAFVTTLASAVAISVMHALKLSSFETSYIQDSYHLTENAVRQVANGGDNEKNGTTGLETLSTRDSEAGMVHHNGEPEVNGNGIELQQQEYAGDMGERNGLESSSPRQRRPHSFNGSSNDQHDNSATTDTPSLQQQQQLQNSNTIGFVDDSTDGYIANDQVMYARSDMWFCLMPALYLLVPGSKILQAGFMDLLGAFVGNKDDEYTALTSSLLVIALGQVIGLRLGFVTLWLFNSAKGCVKGRSRERRRQSTS